MNYKYQIHHQHENFLEFLRHIRSHFKNNAQSIHKARNELKIIGFDGVRSVVKSFKVPHLLNRIIYTYFKKSKAKKSYEHSLKIAAFTPAPIGFIEFYSYGLLDESYFVSEKFEYDFTIREPLLDKDFESREEIFRAFARFTFALHEAGVLHQDYSPGNILIKKEGDAFTFKVVDINRMAFKKLSLDERLKNFSKLWASDADIKTMAQEYAKLQNIEQTECIKKMRYFNTRHKNRINLKKRVKGVKVVD